MELPNQKNFLDINSKLSCPSRSINGSIKSNNNSDIKSNNKSSPNDCLMYDNLLKDVFDDEFLK